MSTIVNRVLYSRIGSTFTARVGNNTEIHTNGISKDYSGVVIVASSVVIGSITCKVVEIGIAALNDCQKVTDIILPNTITTLKDSCIGNNPLIKKIIIPSSVTKVETYFISDMKPDSIIFCGTKEPTMIPTRSENYITGGFAGFVAVPLNYDSSKSTFCLKRIQRENTDYCMIMKEFNAKTRTK